MSWRLVEVGTGNQYCLRPGQFKIGRAQDNDIVINDQTVSRLQAFLEIDPPLSTVYNNAAPEIRLVEKSRFGSTFIDGKNIKPQEIRRLDGNMNIKFGQYKTVFKVEFSPVVVHVCAGSGTKQVDGLLKQCGFYATQEFGSNIGAALMEQSNKDMNLVALRCLISGIPVVRSSVFGHILGRKLQINNDVWGGALEHVPNGLPSALVKELQNSGNVGRRRHFQQCGFYFANQSTANIWRDVITSAGGQFINAPSQPPGVNRVFSVEANGQNFVCSAQWIAYSLINSTFDSMDVKDFIPILGGQFGDITVPTFQKVMERTNTPVRSTQVTSFADRLSQIQSSQAPQSQVPANNFPPPNNTTAFQPSQPVTNFQPPSNTAAFQFPPTAASQPPPQPFTQWQPKKKTSPLKPTAPINTAPPPKTSSQTVSFADMISNAKKRRIENPPPIPPPVVQQPIQPTPMEEATITPTPTIGYQSSVQSNKTASDWLPRKKSTATSEQSIKSDAVITNTVAGKSFMQSNGQMSNYVVHTVKWTNKNNTFSAANGDDYSAMISEDLFLGGSERTSVRGRKRNFT